MADTFDMDTILVSGLVSIYVPATKGIEYVFKNNTNSPIEVFGHSGIMRLKPHEETKVLLCK